MMKVDKQHWCLVEDDYFLGHGFGPKGFRHLTSHKERLDRLADAKGISRHLQIIKADEHLKSIWLIIWMRRKSYCMRIYVNGCQVHHTGRLDEGIYWAVALNYLSWEGYFEKHIKTSADTIQEFMAERGIQYEEHRQAVDYMKKLSKNYD